MLPRTKKKLFCWQGINQQGQATQGELLSSSAKLAKLQLFNQAIAVTRIDKKKRPPRLPACKMTTALWIRLIEQWLYGLRSQLPLNQTLALLIKKRHHGQLHAINDHCYRAIQQGRSLHQALSELHQLKPQWLLDTLSAGEHQGDLCRVFGQIQLQLQQQQCIKKSLKKALFYPATVLVVSLLISLFLLLSVIPQFQSIYTQMNTQLPWFTLCLLQISHQLSQKGPVIFILMITAGLCGTLAYYLLPALQRTCHRLIIKIPKIGALITHQQLARWYGLMALLLEAGLAMDQCLLRTTPCFSNQCFVRMGHALLTAVKNGHTLSSQPTALTLIPQLDQHLLHLGESTGQLSQICQHLSEHHLQALNQFCESINQWLEPSIMIFLAVLIGGLVIAMYAPIIQLGNIV